jgi:O-antigen/teichoic acid export membrane protein
VKRRGIVENSALALAGDVATKAATFLLLAVAARALSTTQFALLATALASATLLTAVFDCGAQVLLTRDGAADPSVRGALLLALTRSRWPLLIAAIIGACVIGTVDHNLTLALGTVLLAVAGAAQQSLSGALRSAQNLRPEALAKVAGAVATLAGGAACVLLSPSATLAMLALGGAAVFVLIPMTLATRRIVSRGEHFGTRRALSRALPLGLMALATLVYYRSGTIALSLGSSAHQTALFASASTLGFALLTLSNAVTTGLLPRLAGSANGADRIAVTRRALASTAAITAGVALAVIAGARPLMGLAFGHRYASGASSLALLAAASVLIGVSGVLGTALIAAGRIRAVAIQVGATLCANLVLLVLLAKPLGADGAALATLGCEALGLAMLATSAARALPGLLALPFGGVRAFTTLPRPER